MAVDHIRYDILTQDALRGVVRTVLTDTAKRGLPGDHHFYISFDTRAEGVRLSPRMQAQYPEEMTVVLQHQFWDLIVTDSGFEVGVSFGGIPERLAIPFAAVTGFYDPSVEFGLKFAEVGETINPELAATGDDPSRPPAEHNVSIPPGQRASVPAPANPEPAGQTTAEASGAELTKTSRPSEKTSGEVVRLDRFRKK